MGLTLDFRRLPDLLLLRFDFSSTLGALGNDWIRALFSLLIFTFNGCLLLEFNDNWSKMFTKSYSFVIDF